MQKLIAGIHHFQENVFSSEPEFFEQMAQGQTPETLFITCSDSRINPNLLTNTPPGELFILRNAGNIIPPWEKAVGGETATIEYAVVALGVRDIIICGHSHCGAMQGLLNPESLEQMPAVRRWLGHAERTQRIMRESYSHLSGDALVTATVQENVLQQLENLRSHQAVADAVSRGKLRLHGWVYQIESGRVFTYDPGTEQFNPIGNDVSIASVPSQPRQRKVNPI
ncbi:MAG: carbonic anhydrase [Gemmatimonas sp.]